MCALSILSCRFRSFIWKHVRSLIIICHAFSIAWRRHWCSIWRSWKIRGERVSWGEVLPTLTFVEDNVRLCRLSVCCVCVYAHEFSVSAINFRLICVKPKPKPPNHSTREEDEDLVSVFVGSVLFKSPALFCLLLLVVRLKLGSEIEESLLPLSLNNCTVCSKSWWFFLFWMI